MYSFSIRKNLMHKFRLQNIVPTKKARHLSVQMPTLMKVIKTLQPNADAPLSETGSFDLSTCCNTVPSSINARRFGFIVRKKYTSSDEYALIVA